MRRRYDTAFFSRRGEKIKKEVMRMLLSGYLMLIAGGASRRAERLLRRRLIVYRQLDGGSTVACV